MIGMGIALWAGAICVGSARLGDEIKVDFELYSERKFKQLADVCWYEEGKGFLRRMLKDGDLPAFGYELHVRKNPDGGKPYHVFVTPVQALKVGYFPRSPEPVDVDENDTVEFVLMEHKESRERLVERFRIHGQWAMVARGSGAGAGDPPRPPAKTDLRLHSPKLARSGEDLNLDSKGMSVSGPMVWVYVPGQGRFWFSGEEKGKFRKTARAEGRALNWEWNGVKYAADCLKDVVELPGQWLVWVRLEEGWRPKPEEYFGEPVEKGFLYMGARGD
jgi:hypothetical protein